MSEHTRPFKPGEHKPVYPGLENDPYALRGKLPEPSACPTCGAVYEKGRWQWLSRPQDAKEVVCTACRRTAEHMPAGYVYIEGSFANDHRAEVLGLINHHAARAKTEHPMQRVMSIDTADDKTVVTTTDVHLARDLGSALQSAFQGTLDLKYSDDEHLVRAYWQR
ncbi:BCAM0308 family protein [Trinickia soli]|uniref:BCAM0308 family protein n=1 Tax=Trinickia soli TaxID=380675 RepID=UPI001255AD11|nr:ATPase [Paraburkholderia sp. T12-10]